MTARPAADAGWIRPAGLAIVAVGIALRVAHYFGGRALWMDEVNLSFNVLSRTFTGLLQAPDNLQFAPLGYLWGEWVMTRLGGAGELALRLIPFLAGVLTLLAFLRLARRILEPAAALVATALAACSPLLVFYSAEAKSYQFDALTAILLAHASLDLVEQGVSRRNLTRWALIAAAASLLSTAAPFIVAGCVVALLVVPRLRSDAGALFRIALAAAPAAVLFLLQWRTIYRAPHTMSFMHAFWAESFLPLTFKSAILALAGSVRELWQAVLFGAEAEAFLPRKSMTIVLALSIAGLVVLFRRHRAGLLLLVAPFGLAILASAFRLWPLTPRLLLFVAPAVFLTVAAALAALARLAPARARIPALMAAALLVVGASARGSAQELRSPARNEPIPRIMQEIATQREGEATVYVSARLVDACTYYSVWHPDRARLVGVSTATACTIRGTRVVSGSWPVDERGVAGKAIPAGWVAAEREKIRQAAKGELWLLFASGVSGADALLPAIEQDGAVPVSRTQLAVITVYKYRLDPRGRTP